VGRRRLGGGRRATPPVVSARGISKRFAGVRALDGAGITVLPGEVHGLLGPNGSGKSTLVKVLAGYHAPDSGGALEVDGQAVALPVQPARAAELGMSFVHQDLGLIPSLSVAENLRLTDLATSRRWFISWPAERRRAQAIVDRFGIAVDPAVRVADLRPVQRAQLAIARAVEGLTARSGNGGRGLLVLDEPAAYLPRHERDGLLALVGEVAAAGAGVLFVTHDLHAALAVAHRVTVLRDGRNAGTVEAAGADVDGLVNLIVGGALAALDAAPALPEGRAAATVAGLSGAIADDVSFAVREREIVGLTGLAGSGFEEVPYLLYGAGRCRTGRLEFGRTHDLREMTPVRALRAGIALLPGDRLHDGGVPSLSVGANVTLPVLARYAPWHRLERRRMRRDAGALLTRQAVRPPDPDVLLGALSGGNQQQALLAKWIGAGPRLLLLDEPTRGVDVGARMRIAAALRTLSGEGVAIVCASGDHEELSRLCDRVLVFGAGRVASELAGDDVTEARIAERCQAGARPARDPGA